MPSALALLKEEYGAQAPPEAAMFLDMAYQNSERLAALVNEHKLRARDPLKPARGAFEGALAEALLPETPVLPSLAARLLAEFKL